MGKQRIQEKSVNIPFTLAQPESFLQSVEWEMFQKILGRKSWRVGKTLLIQHLLPLDFNYLYCPRPADFLFLDETERIAYEEGSLFLKIEPIQPYFAPEKFKKTKASNSLQPPKTLLLDLKRENADILRSMQEKTRYNIRLAERKGVIIRKSKTDDFQEFWKMLEETASRDKFHLHHRSHYEELLQVRSANFSNELFFAEHNGQAIAAAMINFFRPSQTATYLHGASYYKYRQVMSPHFLHWQIIQEAKSRSFGYYDFGGVDAEKWPGLSRFKQGFGGMLFEYPPVIDIVYRPFMYAVYNTARKIL